LFFKSDAVDNNAMKQRPWPIVLLAAFHVIAPVGNILFNAMLTKIPLNIYFQALLLSENRLTLAVFTVVPILGAALIFMCRKWSYISYVILMTVPFVYSVIEYSKNSTTLMAIGLGLFFCINLLVVGYFLKPAVRRLYFDPRLRWWETKPRYQADFQCQVEIKEQQHWVEIKNISEGGAFLEAASVFQEGDMLKLYFKDSEGVIALNGEVIYRREAQPIGYGFKFDKNSSREPRLKEIIKKLSADGALISSRMPGPEDTFVGWLKSTFKLKTTA
jgi:hypothetical protein